MAKFGANRIANLGIPLLCSVVLAALAIWFAIPFLFDQPTPTLHMSAGPDGTRRRVLATYLCAQAKQHNLSVRLTNCAGSEECLNLLKAGQLDVAVVSNGVTVPDDDDVMVLGGIQLEAVHVLVRKEMAEGGPFTETIRGKTVNFGEKGSVEWLLTRELLSFARLKLPSAADKGDVVPTEFSKSDLIDKAHAILQAEGEKKGALIQELPDCVIVIATMPSSIVQLLVEAADYRLVPIPATRAFLSDNWQDSHSKITVLQREFLERTIIPANSYFTTKGFPAVDCETVGARLLVVARKDVAASAICPLMQTIFEGEFGRRIRPKSPREVASTFAIHPAAIAYLDRDKPLAIKEAIDWITKAFSVFGAFSAGALSLYGLFWRKKARKPTDYFTEIRMLNSLLHGTQADPAPAIEPGQLVPYLDDRLSILRDALMEDICEGRIKGDQVIANILALLKDVRVSMTKLDLGRLLPNERQLKAERPISVAA